MNNNLPTENIPVVAIIQERAGGGNTGGPIPGVMNFTEDKTAITCEFAEDIIVSDYERLVIAYDPKTDFIQGIGGR